jgi:8-oxo-dGTP pyrophosphatase MutT (NUDIX family)
LARGLSAAATARLPFFIGSAHVGSVAAAHVAVLRRLAPELEAGGLALRLQRLPEPALDAWFVRVNAALHEAGLIQAWRNETYAVRDLGSLQPVARLERAASRFWGTLTQGAHANGLVAGAGGAPASMWIAQRAFNKATDPGKLDNLVGGGVPHDQTPEQALWRECWEEAGLPEPLARQAHAVGVLRLARDIPEGFQLEDLHTFDLWLPDSLVPLNQDGEVARFERVAVPELLHRQLWRDMTTDAAMVTLHCLVRHGWMEAGAAQRERSG